MEQIWNNVKTVLKENMPYHRYIMWIDPMEYTGHNNEDIVLSCPNSFLKKKILDSYGELIESEFFKVSGKQFNLAIKINERNETKKKQKQIKKNNDDFNFKKYDKKHQLKLPEINFQPLSGRRLRKELTFDNFVVGDNNEFAYTASLSLASRQNSTQNSLFLISKTGMGKTHLSQAMGHYILSKFPSERVYYITAEDYTNEMVSSIRNNTIEKFKEKYRAQCDVLLLEDVHFLTGKVRTQSELALALDYMYELGKKIIFTSHYIPGEIPNLSDQLRSRLTCGLISNIEPPNFRTRVRILLKKSKDSGFIIPREITEYLAGELSENVRQLEGGLIGITAKSSLLGRKIDRELAESVVKNISRQKKTITIDSIKDLVCGEYKISKKDLISSSRKQSLVRPRRIAIYLARQYTDQPLQAIGKSFNRIHATAIHSIRAVEKGIKTNSPIKKEIEYLCKKLDSGT